MAASATDRAPERGAARVPVLCVCYYFPPLGGAGVQRSSKFVKYLPDQGFAPIVVAGPGRGQGEWEPEDGGLARELPADLPVYRAASEPPADARGRFARLLARLLGRPSARDEHWCRTIREEGRRAAAAHAPRLVYASLSPFCGLEPASEIARELGVPLVADLRDPWALDEMQVYPSRWHRRRALAAMGRALALADGIVMNTPESLRALRAEFPRLASKALTVITNGYDADDFAGVAPAPRGERLRIVHSGYLHTSRAVAHDRRMAGWKRHLGGARTQVDFHGRSARYLLEALAGLSEDERARVELHLLGRLSAQDEAALDASPAAGLVHRRGYLPHDETVRELAGADLLFLPMHGLPPGERARIVPGKTYEYLASGRPILAAVPESDARDFVAASGVGHVVAPNDVEGLRTVLREALAERAARSSGGAKAESDGAKAESDGARADRDLATDADARPLPPSVTRFERRELTRSLASFFDELVRS